MTIRIESASHYFQPIENGAALPDLDSTLAGLCRENFRRIDRFIQLALLGSARCAGECSLQTECGIYLGSGLGPIGNNVVTQEQLIRDREIPKPFNFINTLGSSAGYYVARNLGLRGQNFFISRRGASMEAALSSAIADLEAGIIDQALVGAVEEVTLPLAEHRKRQGLPDEVEVAEGSHWLLLQLEGKAGGQLQIKRFTDYATLERDLISSWRTGDVLRCGIDIDAGFASALYHALPDSYVADPKHAFHDSLSAAWLTEFITGDGVGNLFLVNGDEVRGWTLFHCTA